MGEATRVEGKASEAGKEKVDSQKQNTGLSQSICSPIEQMLLLQRTIGNQAVGRFIKSGVLQAKLRVDQPERVSDPISSRNILEPVVQRQEVEFDLEVPTPEERERLRQRGIQLPGVSPQTANPRDHSDYVDRRLNAVGFGIYLGGYVLYIDGLDIPVFVPESHFNFDAINMEPADLAIFPDHNAALANVPMGPQAPGQPIPYTYYRGAGGAIIAPTLFTPVTTPRVIQTALQARRQLAEYVQEQLIAVAIGIVGGMIIRGVIGWLARVGGGRGAPPSSRLSPAATRARDLARQTRAQGKPVIANIGGAGASHEPPGAININNQAVGRRGIPNHVNADGSDIGQLFDAGSLDQVVGHHMPPSVINWQRAIPGIHNALRPGGTFRYDWRGATSEAAQVVRLLREAGFREVNNMSNAYVTAVRP